MGVATTSNGDPNGGNTADVENENENEQENELELTQVALAGQKCEGLAVFCANVALT